MDTAGRAAALTHPRHFAVERIEQFCVVPGGCVSTEPLVPILAFLMTGVLAILLAATIVHIRNARELLEEERDRTRAERDAFAAFSRRVALLEASQTEITAGTDAPVASLSGTSGGDELREVEDIYRDTVMSTSHYTEEYDESLATNMAAEFSEEVAAAVTDGTGFTQQVKHALMTQSQGAREQREEFLRQLDREAEDLDESEGTLSEIEATLEAMNETPLRERSFADLVDAWERLGELEERCRDVLEARQHTVHGQASGRVDMPTLQEYLYRTLPVTYPVIAAGTALTDHIDTARSRVVRSITRRA